MLAHDSVQLALRDALPKIGDGHAVTDLLELSKEYHVAFLFQLLRFLGLRPLGKFSE